MKAYELHRRNAPRKVGFYVVTVSTSRYRKKLSGEEFVDGSGDVAEKLILRHKHDLIARELISDDADLLKSALQRGMSKTGVDVILFTGGTGISPTDITVETIRPLLKKELDGFGEMLRYRSFPKIGSSAILTRATAGIIDGRVILCLPGSPDGVDTALKMFIREIPHVVHVARG